MLTENEFGSGKADIFGMHDLVGDAVFQHAVLVDTGFVGKSILSNNCLVSLHVDAGGVGDEPAGG